METLTYSSGRASGCDSPGLLNLFNLVIPFFLGGLRAPFFIAVNLPLLYL